MHEIHAWKKKQAQNDMNLRKTLLNASTVQHVNVNANANANVNTIAVSSGASRMSRHSEAF